MNRPVTKTLLYSDLFDYPLTFDQLHKYLITSKKISKKKVKNMAIEEKKLVSKKSGFYFLKNREDLVLLREKREKESAKKIKYGLKKTGILKYIPGIKFLGISGSLSLNNASPADDIDLFIISEKNKIWLTRLIAVFLLKIQGVYRDRNETNPSNKLCLNMIIDENNLLFPKSRQDIYTAHEIAQVLPVYDRKNTYTAFIKTNKWIRKYLANFEPENIKEEKINMFPQFLWELAGLFWAEKFAKFIHQKYMRKQKNRETIKDGFLAFHPNDSRLQIINTYKMRLKSIKISTRGY